MGNVKWIKIATDIFGNPKIKQIRKMPEGDAIIGIWFQMLCLAGVVNENGIIFLTKDVPYTEEMLATEFDRPINIIRLALMTFERFQMIEIIDNLYLVSNWEKYQSADKLQKIREDTRLRVAKHRQKQREISNVTGALQVTQGNAIEEEQEEEQEEEYDIYNVDVMFDIFWDKYPRKESKSKAKDWFKKNKPSQELLDRMLVSIEQFKKTSQWKNKEYIPHPSTWLNQKRWEDEVDLSSQPQNKAGNNKKSAPVPDWYENYANQLKGQASTKVDLTPVEESELQSLVDDIFGKNK